MQNASANSMQTQVYIYIIYEHDSLLPDFRAHDLDAY